MGKLGKKARKFAKKNLQSVLRRRRKTKALHKKRTSSRNENGVVEDQFAFTTELSNGRNTEVDGNPNTSLEEVFTECDGDMVSDASDSDGFLSEDSSCSYFVESENEDDGYLGILSVERGIQENLALQKRKLDKLKKKDPEFVKFLNDYEKGEIFRNEEMESDQDDTNNREMQLVDELNTAKVKGKLLTSSVINSWIQQVTEEHSQFAGIGLLNAYRAACHLGTESIGLPSNTSSCKIENSDVFCNIVTFVLREAKTIFCDMLKIPPNCKKEAVLELKNTSKWKGVRPLVKSYLRSTLFLLNQVTDSEILAFSLTSLRPSLIFFAAFPSLLHRLVKVLVPLWATSEGTLSSCSFLVISDVASLFSTMCFDACLVRTYKAYISRCRNLENADVRHVKFLQNSFVELCSLDVEKSSVKAIVSIELLASILRQALREKKEAAKKICSWQYVMCVEIWVLFISGNVCDHDIQPLFYMTVQLINGVASLFPGPRYFPLRVKCIRWLSELASSSKTFIPVTSLVLDILEYKINWEGGKRGAIEFSSHLKLSKYWLRHQEFQERVVSSAVELLSAHLAQWSYHISFPELATIPLIRLRKFHEFVTNQNLRHVVRRLIDLVEQNVEFVQKKRNEIAFSPKDHQEAELFQIENGSLNSPFTQYYKSVLEKAASKMLHSSGKMSSLKQRSLKRNRGLPAIKQVAA